MLRMDLYNVLISPVITEKANTVAEKNEQVVFKVLKQATKAGIKAAFEIAFNAQVETVRVLNVHGKSKTIWSLLMVVVITGKSLYQLKTRSKLRFSFKSEITGAKTNGYR